MFAAATDERERNDDLSFLSRNLYNGDENDTIHKITMMGNVISAQLADPNSGSLYLWSMFRFDVMTQLVHLTFELHHPGVQLAAAALFDKIGLYLWDFLEDGSASSSCINLLESADATVIRTTVQVLCKLNFQLHLDDEFYTLRFQDRQDVEKKSTARLRLASVVSSSQGESELREALGRICRRYTQKVREKLIFDSEVLASFRGLLLDENVHSIVKCELMALFSSKDEDEINRVIDAGFIPIFVSLLNGNEVRSQTQAGGLLGDYFLYGTDLQVVRLIQENVLENLLEKLSEPLSQGYNEANCLYLRYSRMANEFSRELIVERVKNVPVIKETNVRDVPPQDHHSEHLLAPEEVRSRQSVRGVVKSVMCKTVKMIGFKKNLYKVDLS